MRNSRPLDRNSEKGIGFMNGDSASTDFTSNRKQRDREKHRILYLLLEYYSRLSGITKEEFLSKLFGARNLGKLELSMSEKHQLSQRAEDFVSLIPHLQRELENTAKNQNLSGEEKYRRVRRSLSNLSSLLGVPSNEDVLDMLIQGYHDLYQTLLQSDFRDYQYLAGTSFFECKSAAEAIIAALYRSNKQDAIAAGDFFDQLSKSNDTYVLLSMSIHAENHYKYMNGRFGRMTKRTVEKLIDTYRWLSGIFEKQLRTLVGLHQMSIGKKLEYRRIRKYPLGLNLNLISKASPSFRLLVSPLNKDIRNSIAHGSYRPDYVERRIEFLDSHPVAILKYDQFIHQTKELSAVVMVLFYIYLFWLWCHFGFLRDCLKAQV
ncbi:MAG: hypothetical protein WED05_00490 [Candidatus Atabeyarchaeum deiterrae]